jgi:hypothetical protein
LKQWKEKWLPEAKSGFRKDGFFADEAMDTDSQKQQQWNDQSLIINATKQGHQTPIGKR